jgi:hypothetical protein
MVAQSRISFVQRLLVGLSVVIGLLAAPREAFGQG